MSIARPDTGRSLGDLHPVVASEWHPSKNAPLTAFDLKPASAKTVWWQCTLGHEWPTKPQNRLRGERCPECAKTLSAAKRSTPKPGRSLADLYPDIAADWNTTRNGDVTASDVNPGSKTNRWWKCRVCSHEWSTDPDHRTRSNRGCPQCARSRISKSKSTPKPGESLADTNPTLAAEWHPHRNEELTAFDVKPRSKRKVWWQCAHGHEWHATVAPRSVGIGCPKCSTVGASEREIRLAHELAAAGFSVDHDHPPIPVVGRRPVQADIAIPDLQLVIEYDGAHYHRTGQQADLKQTQALIGAGWAVIRVREQPLESLGGMEVFVSASCAIKQLTDTVLIEAAKHGYRADNHDRYLASETCWATENADLAVYKNRSKSIANSLPDIAPEWHPTRNGSTTPDQVHPGNSTKFWWECRTCGREWQAAPVTRAAGHGCSACGHRRGGATLATPHAGESFADLHPKIAAEWHPTLNHPLDPSHVKPFSSKKAWWRCTTCAHDWKAAISTRSTNHGCPKCAAREGGIRSATPQEGQSLADRFPDVAAQWHPTMNNSLTALDVKPFSTRKAWWLCSDGHDWKAPIAGRSRGEGCPTCANVTRGKKRATPKDGESVADLFPDIAAQWHSHRNGTVTAQALKPGSNVKIWWTCPECGNEWPASPKSRCLNGGGCPPCGRKRAGLARALPKPGQSLADLHPAIAAEWHPHLNGDLRPDAIKPGRSKKVWWKCQLDHEWEALPKSRTGLGSGCPKCSQLRRPSTKRQPKS
jgi:hypothetical protein